MKPLQHGSTVAPRRRFVASRDRGLKSTATFIDRSAVIETASIPLILKATWNYPKNGDGKNRGLRRLRGLKNLRPPHGSKNFHPMGECRSFRKRLTIRVNPRNPRFPFPDLG